MRVKQVRNGVSTCFSCECLQRIGGVLCLLILLAKSKSKLLLPSPLHKPVSVPLRVRNALFVRPLKSTSSTTAARTTVAAIRCHSVLCVGGAGGAGGGGGAHEGTGDQWESALAGGSSDGSGAGPTGSSDWGSISDIGVYLRYTPGSFICEFEDAFGNCE